MLLQSGECLVNLAVEPLWLLAVGVHVCDARFGRDGEARRYAVRTEDAGHLRDVRAFSTKEFAHVASPFLEGVDPLGFCRRRHGPYHIRRRRRTCAWCSTVSETARSTARSSVSRASGASESGFASASTMNRWASWLSGNELASQPGQTTPPAAA